MSLQSTLSAAADGYLCPGPSTPLSIVSSGYLCFIVVQEDAGEGIFPGSIRVPSEDWDLLPLHMARLVREDDEFMSIIMMTTIYGLMEPSEE